MMNFLKTHKTLILSGLAVLVVLVAAFVWGGNYAKHTAPEAAVRVSASTATLSPLPSDSAAPSSAAPDTATAVLTAPSPTTYPTVSPSPTPSAAVKASATPTLSTSPSPSADAVTAPTAGDATYSEISGMVLDPKTNKDQYQTDPVPSGMPLPVEPENATHTEKKFSCTLTVRCDTILENMDLLDKDKHELIPEDGVVFPETSVTFYDGESVFNVLQREMKKAKIQMEFKNIPLYNSAYIESINNLYEFDVGELSGWMYKVNGWFPNYGCSRYQLKDGDVIVWEYTCDLGKDIGGYYSVGAKT